MGLVKIEGDGVLAYVLPTPEGGTELVYLASEGDESLALRGHDSDEIGDRVVRAGPPRNRPTTP